MTAVVERWMNHPPASKCAHLRSGVDSYSFPLVAEGHLFCRTCYEETDVNCHRCGKTPNPELVYCTLTVKHFGASAWEDHFVAKLCKDCGGHIPLGIRPSVSEFQRHNDMDHILIIQGSVDRSAIRPPKMPFTDKQRAKLERAWKKASLTS
jgi:hypothetical protein